MHFSIAAALAAALAGPALAAPGVSPATVSKAADPGSSFKVDKLVTTPKIPPTPDVVLLVDVTGSMGSTIANIKENLAQVITTVRGDQPNAQFAVVSFGDLDDPNGFAVVQDMTSSTSLLQTAVNSLVADLGGDPDEDWINALYQISTGAVTFRTGSSRIIVLVSDAPSKDPSGGHTLEQAIDALKTKIAARVIGVNVSDLDGKGQATAVTSATGGVIIGSAAEEVSKAIVSGLKNLDVTVKPNVVSCDAGLTVEFQPTSTTVPSGDTVIFKETVKVAAGAVQGAALHCSVRFLLNGAPGGTAFVQSVTVRVNRVGGCDKCIPQPGQNLCHITTSCAPTPFGTMCLTRPGYKADGAADDDINVHWRLKWPVPGHEHRVAVKPGTSADTLCDPKHTGPDVCQEVVVADCKSTAAVGQGVPAQYDDNSRTQEVIAAGDRDL
ncbi:hypothetical protein B0T24DRAFT_599789 [Lasiosphaeria ovina]|uniref:VWFA domain-containing protein n=1 Tax=Lasiosphaeria ovina TaxID=92902 RepID=A0AAE0JSM1_9PEZI|nr:hypothetical protein B0T24DRAFT_599789 [Lasiosphaeria ovina]